MRYPVLPAKPVFAVLNNYIDNEKYMYILERFCLKITICSDPCVLWRAGDQGTCGEQQFAGGRTVWAGPSSVKPQARYSSALFFWNPQRLTGIPDRFSPFVLSMELSLSRPLSPSTSSPPMSHRPWRQQKPLRSYPNTSALAPRLRHRGQTVRHER